MDASSARFDANRMFEVQHLVIQQVFDGATRSVRSIEYAADDNGIVCGIVMAQHAAGLMRAPRESGTTEKAVEEAGVERLKHLIQIVMMTGGSEDALASAGLTNMFGLA